MTMTDVPNLAVLRMAKALGVQGFRIVRVYANDKRPVGDHWPERATDDVDALTKIFASGPANIGLACGPQPNGLNVVVVDVDTKDGGVARWAGMVAEHGLPDTAWHATPSGGSHWFFDVGDLDINNGKLAPGIDLRGVGGQVVIPPSSRLVDGVERFYTEGEKGSGVHRHPIAEPPLWLERLLVPEVGESVARHPSVPRTGPAGGDQSPGDWLRDHWDWEGVLVGQGHTVARRFGKDIYLRHPTATARWSAVVHLDSNMMNAWSTNMPSHPRGLVNTDGSVPWSPFDWFSASEFGGDYGAASREINRRRFPEQVTVGERAAPNRDPGATAGVVAPESDVTPLFLPVEWYDQRPWMAACRQMAQAVGGSPSAHLLAYLTRWATLIPPGYTIPPINGAPSSFDLLSVIAGTSGSGKTSPMTNAEFLVPIQRKDMRMGLGLGSGEGIIETFFTRDEFEGEDGKKKVEKRKTIRGVNFSVSEGLIFADLSQRGGTTHVTRLCDAWSGAALSTANASAETFRHVERGQYRLTMVMGIQASQAHKLMTDDAASQGFVGRLLFCWAEEPRVKPRPDPPAPPLLIVPGASETQATHDHPLLFKPVLMTYPPEVYAEIQDASDARVGTDVPVEDHHHDLLRCKVAGIVALMEGRTAVSLDDWAIATDLVETSAAVRKHLYAQRLQESRDKGHRVAEAKGELEYITESVKERRYIASMAERIRAKTTEPVSLGKLTRALTSDSTRHRFDPALALAVSNGWVVVEDGKVRAL